jgi:hypothetical protein
LCLTCKKQTPNGEVTSWRKEWELAKNVVWQDGSWETTKSITGVLIFVFGLLVYLRSTTQENVATSSTHSELQSLLRACKEGRGVRNIIGETLGIGEAEKLPPTVILGDNQNALRWGQEKVQTSKTKFLPLNYHFIQESVDEKHFDLREVRSKHNLADLWAATYKVLPTKHVYEVLGVFLSKYKEV